VIAREGTPLPEGLAPGADAPAGARRPAFWTGTQDAYMLMVSIFMGELLYGKGDYLLSR
jgi:hypothetical protein